MKPAALLLLALPLLLPTPAAAAKIAKEKLTFKGQERRYALYVPDAVAAQAPTAAAKVPLVLVFHEGRSDGDALVSRWRKQADQGGFVVAGVDALNKAQWNLVSEPPALFRQMIDAIAAKAPVDPRRVYLFGNWDGGLHAIAVALIESEYFTAVATHASAFQPGQYGILDAAKRKLPVSIQMGNQDQNVGLRMELVRGTEEQMRQRGLPIEVAVLRGHDNFYAGLSGKINQQAWEFLSRHTLPGEPVFRDPDLHIQVEH
ncbi:MAG TPA: hypothetical protein VEG34_15395 [Thermoanaerobaculia bacterium]|nr:hypothetical protein [Thermoanaerobaculia bacterium]